VRWTHPPRLQTSNIFVPDGTSATQINRIVSHPTMSLLVTAHEDKFIRIFDIVTGWCLLASKLHLIIHL